MLCTGLGFQEAETIHALLHHLVGVPNGPNQVHLQKARLAREDCTMDSAIIRVRHLILDRKAIKGQAIADYLADYPSEQLELMDSEFPNEDVMAIDERDHCRWKLLL